MEKGMGSRPSAMRSIRKLCRSVVTTPSGITSGISALLSSIVVPCLCSATYSAKFQIRFSSSVSDQAGIPVFCEKPLTITLEDGKLMSQATGQSKVQLFPESETRFFLKVVDAQIAFKEGEDGTFDSLVLYQGGQEVPGKRKE